MKTQSLGHVFDFIVRTSSLIGNVGGSILIAGMLLLITIDVLGRYFLGMTTYVAGEISGYLLVGVCTLGLVYTQRKGANI